jgi:hypothetical protein
VLLRGNSTNAYISYHMSNHSIRIIEYHRKNLLSLNSRAFAFTVSSAVISFKDVNQDFTHFVCIKKIAVGSDNLVQTSCTINVLNYEVYYIAVDRKRK